MSVRHWGLEVRLQNLQAYFNKCVNKWNFGCKIFRCEETKKLFKCSKHKNGFRERGKCRDTIGRIKMRRIRQWFVGDGRNMGGGAR